MGPFTSERLPKLSVIPALVWRQSAGLANLKVNHLAHGTFFPSVNGLSLSHAVAMWFSPWAALLQWL